jgi:FkbM family methyltransferase
MLEKIGIYFIDFKKLRDNAVIVDAGACRGEFIKIMNQCSQSAKSKIMAIECDKDNINILREKNFPNVTICEKALVGYGSRKNLIYHKYIGRPYSGSVGYEKTYIKKCGEFKGIQKYEVETLGINDIFSELGIDRIDYMKMNIEGLERDVMAAMTEETASRIDQISISIHANILSDLSSTSLKKSARIDIIQRLNELGFKAWKIDRRLIYGVFNKMEA